MPFIHRKEKRKGDSATSVNHAFFGRVPEIAFFKEGILAPETPAYNIISISGIAGVGKTTFLAKIKEEVNSPHFKSYCRIAYVNERATDPLNIMEQFAQQLQIKGDFKTELENCKEAFLRIHQEQNEFRETLLREIGTLAGSAVKSLPVPGAPLFGEAAGMITQTVSKQLYLHQQFQDAKRLEHAIPDVTKAFLKELRSLVLDQRSIQGGHKRFQRILLCFDTFEKLAPEAAPWLLDMISAEDIEADIVFVVAGQHLLDHYPPSRTKEWLPYLENGIFHKIQLALFTKEETYQYLSQRGIQDEADKEKVWNLSGGLPLYLGLLIAHSEGNIDPRHGVVENFLRWIPEDESAKRRLVVEVALLSKPFNQDNLEAFPYIEREKYSETYQWLMVQPLIRHNRDNGTCSYHEVIQDLFCEHLRHTAPSEYSAARRALVAHYQRQLKRWDTNEIPDDIWCETVFALVQQHIALDTKEDQAEIIEWSVLASQQAGKKSMLGTLFKRYWEWPRMPLSLSMKNLLSLLSYYLVERDALEKTDIPILSFSMGGTVQVQIPAPIRESHPFFTEAIKLSPKIIGLDPGYYLMHTMLSLVMRQYEEALDNCANVIAVNPMNAQSYFLRALVYRAMHEDENALADCNKAIALSPQEAQFYFLRAHVYRAMRDDQNALTNYTRAIELAPQEAQLYFVRAQVYTSLQEHEKALTDCTRAIELAPQEDQFYSLRAQIYLAMQEYEQALADCNTALDLPCQEPNQVRDTQPTKHAQMVARTLIDKIAPSTTQFTKLVQKLANALADEREKPSSQPIRDTQELIRTLIVERIRELTSGLKELLESPDARPDDTGRQQIRELKDLLESFDIEPDEIEQREVRELKALPESSDIELDEMEQQVRAQIDELVQKIVSRRIDEYLSKARFDKFEKTMTENFGPPSTEYDPPDEQQYRTSEAYFVRAQVYEAMQEYDKALADYTNASELVPGEAWPYYYRGKVYQAKDEPDKALADYTKAIKLESQEAQFYITRAHIFQEKDDSEKALADYTKAIELEPTSIEGYSGRARVYLTMGESEKALADSEQIIELMPTSALPYIGRGALYGIMKEYEKALIDFAKAIELEPANAYAYFTRSQIYQEMDEREKAQADIDKATRLDPSIVERNSSDEGDDGERSKELST